VIKQISFYDSVCAVHKYERPKTNPFQTVITGEIANVAKVSPSIKSVIEQNDIIEKTKELYFGK
jgi:hypothetical protein